MPTKNHELARAHSRTHYHRHKEERIRKARAWHLAHPDEIAQINERSRSKPEVRERHRANVRRQKYERRGAPGYYTEEQLQARIDFYGRRCYLCDCDWDALPAGHKHIDHVVPISLGGTNWPANLRPACETCNLSKNAKPLDKYLALL